MRGVLVIALVGCQSTAAVPASVPVPLQIKTQKIQITDGGFAREHAAKTKHTALPFAFIPEGVNGTKLMMQFLGYAEEHGARYASDLSIILQMTHDGATVECVSKVVVDDGAPRAVVAEAPASPSSDGEYTTTIRPWQPDQVRSVVDEHDVVCEKHAEQVMVEETIVPDRNDAEVKRYMPPGTNRVVRKPTIVWHDECQLKPQRREVMRYEHFLAAHFEPPDWDALGHAYAERKLIELPPQCHQIPTPAQTVQRVEGDLSYLGSYGQTPVSDPTPPEKTPWTRLRTRP